MQYRTLGSLDWKPSALGFGAMRFPLRDEDAAHIDEEQAERMLRYALDHGVNYIDTAYPYHGGASERFLGRFLVGSYQDRAKLATKLPPWKVDSADDFDRLLDEQLERLDRDSVDFYLLHALNAESWTKLQGLDVLDWAERAMAQGKFAHLGFSFHDDYPVFREIVDAYDNWSLCQIQYNYMDTDYQAGREGLRYAAARGLGVVIMEPLRGGQLAKEPPPRVAPLWAGAVRPWTPVEWALQWLWDQPEVSLVLSGMSTLGQVEENVTAAARSAVGTLTEDERRMLERIRDGYLELRPIPCTACGYCQPCPSGVAIPRILGLYNQSAMYDDPDRARMGYRMTKEEQRADRCTECGRCEELCPQGISIIRWLQDAHALLNNTP